MWLLAVAKPFVIVWAGLRAIDDMSLVMRVGRLALVALPGGSNQEDGSLCDVCDDVMGDLLAGTGGLSVVPCHTACLGLEACVNMCEKVKDASATSTEFPCVVAGYCDAVEADVMDSDDVDCRPGPLFSCLPRRYCRRRRTGMKMTCGLRPGIGRWVGLKNAAGSHVVALASGLVTQAHCGEEGAGPYCIAKPTGWGAIAELVGLFLSLIYGGYKSVVAIESPGGDDDRQWLTFWVIFTATLFCEKYFARVILSTVPFYYEGKLLLLIWLLWRSGAEKIYRKLRRFLTNWNLLLSDNKAAEQELAIMKSSGKSVVMKQLSIIEEVAEGKKRNKGAKLDSSSNKKDAHWEYKEDDSSPATIFDADQKMYLISKYLLSAEGTKALEQASDITEQDATLLIQRAAAIVSFQPRFLRIHLRGMVNGPEGELPPMDRNGLADAYVTCRIIPESGEPYPKKAVQSRTVFRSVRPKWTDELEIPLQGGSLGKDGYYDIGDGTKKSKLLLDIRDADVGLWRIAYIFFCIALFCVIATIVVARIEGISDTLSDKQWLYSLSVVIVVNIGFVVTYYMSVMRRSDDQRIGVCSVPIGMLLDQREHLLLLKLRKEETTGKGKEKANGAGKTKTNKAGGLGIMRASLMLSET